MVSRQTEENAAHLCAELCRYIGITADTVDKYVLRHWDVWSKDCPSGWTGSSNSRWDGFKDRVKAILRNESEDLAVAQYDELKAEIASVKAENAAIKAQNEKLLNVVGGTFVYNYNDSNIPTWHRDAVSWATVNKIVEGTGEGLNLTDWKLWTLTIMYRTAKWLAKLVNVRI